MFFWHRVRFHGKPVLVRVEQGNANRYWHPMDDDFSTYEAPITTLYYVCGGYDCEKTYIKTIEGHWTSKELTSSSPGFFDAY